MMRAWSRRGPARSLPALHTPQFTGGRVVQLDDAVDLPIWVCVVLAREFLLAVQIYSRDAEVASCGRRDSNFPAAVVGGREL